VLAEPAYILLAESGVPDAHEVIRKITLAAEKESLSFSEALAREGEILDRISSQMAALGIIPSGKSAGETAKAALAWFQKPEQYRGLAAKKARDIAEKYKKIVRG